MILRLQYGAKDIGHLPYAEYNTKVQVLPSNGSNIWCKDMFL